MLEQPYEYSARELVEPDWRRLPGFADVTDEQWRSAQWQRVTLREEPPPAARRLRRPARRVVLRRRRGRPGRPGDDVAAAAAADAQHDGARPRCRRPPRCWPTRCAATCCPVASDRLPGAAASHPYAARDSLHEHEMWAVEGLTHRYPTKVLAELLSTCPQYCGHCTRMDLVGNSTPAVPKLKFELKPVDRQAAMLDYLRATPGVRDVVVSGGDVANLPFKNLEAFVAGLLEIESVRDIRLATKALMGLPQHWLQDDVVEGMTRLATTARARGVSLAVHTHVNAAQSVTPLVAEAAQAMLAAGVRDVRNQGVLLRGRQRLRPAQLLDLCFALLDGAVDHALLLLHVRHDPQRRALAGVAGPGADAAARHHGLPARLRDAADRLRRALRRQALGAPGRRVRPRARHQLLDEELPHRHRAHRRGGAGPPLHLLRPDRDAAGERAGVVGRARARPGARPRCAPPARRAASAADLPV